MAAGLSTANTANPLLDTFRGLPFDVDNLYLQLHTGDPGSAGTSNVSVVRPQGSRSPWVRRPSGF